MSAHQAQTFDISFGNLAASVCALGAHLRSFTDTGRDVIVPFDAGELPPAAHGAILAPWPNRLAHGSYTFQGTDYQLDISEPERMVALHGLVRWLYWDLVEHTGTAVELAVDLAPQPGYPWPLHLRTRYELSPFGLAVTITARNDASTDAPYGVGFHPWLSPGTYPLDECTVRVDATTRLIPNTQLLPVGSEAASGDWDLMQPTPLAGLDLDDCYTDVIRDEDGLAWIILTSPDGVSAALWMDHTGEVFQICTGDHVKVPWTRTGLAAEPQSCAANSFNTGARLIVLGPGETHTLSAGLRALREE